MKEALDGLLNGILGMAREGQIDAFKAAEQQPLVQAALTKVRLRSPIDFRRVLLRPFEQLATGVLLAEVGQNHSLHFLFMESQYVERQVRAVIERAEGGCCVADKTRSVVRALARYLADQTPIAFNYGAGNDFAFPKIVLTTQTEIVAFFEAIQSLHYGRPEKYLAVLQSIAQKASSSLTRSAE